MTLAKDLFVYRLVRTIRPGRKGVPVTLCEECAAGFSEEIVKDEEATAQVEFWMTPCLRCDAEHTRAEADREAIDALGETDEPVPFTD